MKSHPVPSTPAAATSRILACIATIGITASAAHALSIEITGAGSYSQDFNTLPTSGNSNTWTDDVTIPGWYASRTTLIASTGSGNSGGLYSFGASSNSERALGSLASGSTGTVGYGVLFQNNSGGAITIDSIAYTGEQWRNGGNTTAHVLSLAYLRDVNPITTPGSASGWTDLPSGNFTGPVATATTATLDGNLATNRNAISINPAISVPAGEYIMIRWRDQDDQGADHSLAIDDLTITWSTSATPALGLSANPDIFAETAGSSASTGTVTIPAALGTDLEVALESSDITEATVPATVTILAGQTSATFPIDAIDDFLVDGSQNVALTATAAGYINAQSGIIVDDDVLDAPIAVSVDPLSIAENNGIDAATGTVTISQNTPVDLTVNLSTFSTSISIPVSVTILNGTNSATFQIDAIDDSVPNGTRNATITASAVGYTSGNTQIQIQDDGDTAPAPTLNPGDIAFIGFNADGNDDLAFVALAPIAGGDVIHFTDNEWNGLGIGEGGAFNTGEGYISWTAPAGGVAQGAVVTLNSLSTSGRSASVGTVSASGSFNLGGSAESTYAFQGVALTTGATGFLAVVATHTIDSVAGTGLAAEHIIYLPTNVDIAEYTASRSNQPVFADYLTPISNPANWTTQDGSGDQNNDTTEPDVPFDTTPFTLGSPTAIFASWAAENGIAGEPFDGDFDGDGISNGLEYAIAGLNPAQPDAAPGSFAAGVLSFTKRAEAVAAGDVSWQIEESTDLGITDPWAAVTPGIDDGTTISYTLPTGLGKAFARLKVTQSAP